MQKIICYLFMCLLLTVSVYAQQNKIDYGNNAAAGKYYNIRGIKMYCEIYGSGKPLLMIHGNGGSMSAFSNNIPYFAKKYTVIAVDSRSQGKSIDIKDSLSFEMMADDFAALLDTLHIDSVYVIGWSDGGINALLLAIRHPEKVIKLVSTGANLWPDSTALIPSLWKEMQAYYDTSFNKKRTTEKEKNDWKIFMLDYNQPHIPLSALHTIKCPSLIICGDHDLIPIPHTKLIAENIPNSIFWVVPNSGHATLIEHKDEFNKKADEFFSNPFKQQ
jgi:pimeloyl-ACP methyl ester carboxylesterase